MDSSLIRNRRTKAKVLQKLLVVLIVTLLGSPLPVFAQTSTVYGTITDRSGRPVVNILVEIGSNYRYTDVSGRYKIVGVPLGQQHMVCRRGSTILWQGDVQIAGSEMVLNRQFN
ncbi:MAG TPA: carboxypeptidase-like regulatory domain-containing protein [Dongiaceae bacterium]|nr:carboxypeptidase-like regulatory domain-containing protein [Dongiaceae bacterium]